MARTATPYRPDLKDATSTAVDTAGYGVVTIMGIATGAVSAGDIVITVGDTESVDTTPVTTIVDARTKQVVDVSTLTAQSGEAVILSYIGEKRYLTATGGASLGLVVLLEEQRDAF